MKSAPDTTLRIDSLQWPVTVLGYGTRVGIWFQGCSIGCPGCCAKHTWNADEGKLVALTDLFAWIQRLPLEEVNGVTITGGEPFEQPKALHRLVAALRSSVDFRQDIDILCYSGFPWKHLSQRHGDILQHLDAVIAEPYVEKLAPQWLRGSDNQTIHLLSALAKRRYADASRQTNGLQVVAVGDDIRIIGIPNRGDLERMQEKLAGQGVAFGEWSW